VPRYCRRLLRGRSLTSRERFTLTVERSADSRVSALVIQVTPPHDIARKLRLNGEQAGLVASSVHSIIQRARLSKEWTSRRPIELDPRVGAQVGLLLRAVKPLRRVDRLERIATGVAAMSGEEASYWYAKSDGPRGLRALRLLLASEARS
jgi:hypothetical protein